MARGFLGFGFLETEPDEHERLVGEAQRRLENIELEVEDWGHFISLPWMQPRNTKPNDQQRK